MFFRVQYRLLDERAILPWGVQKSTELPKCVTARLVLLGE